MARLPRFSVRASLLEGSRAAIPAPLWSRVISTRTVLKTPSTSSYIEGFEGAVGMCKKDYVAQGIRDFQKAARQGAIMAYT